MSMLTQDQIEPGFGLNAFFEANRIAVIGASNDITKIGGRPIQLLRKFGYAGIIYPVNPKGGTIQDLSAYASVLDIPETPDLAIVAVPAHSTLQAIRDCGERGIRGVIVFTTGFAEAGPEGAAMQVEMVDIARRHGMRLQGPNCLGMVNVINRMIGSFSISLEQNLPPAGQVGVVSQSGNIGSFAMRSIADRGMGVSRFIATGNEADVDVADGIASLAQDPATGIILCCMETCRQGNRLIKALNIASQQKKPVIILKIGATEQGQAAATSHTGALSGSDAVFDAALRRYGALRVRSFEELLDIGHATALLGVERLPATNAVTLMTASGGFGIMMADAMVEAGMVLPQLAEETKTKIHEALPIAGTNNPVDASAQMLTRPDILQKMLTALQEDPSGSTLVIQFATSLHTPRVRGVFMEALTQIRASHPDRLLAVITNGPKDAVAELNSLGIPVFANIPAAATGLAGLARLGQLSTLPPAVTYDGPMDRVDPVVFRNEFYAKKALGAAGISVPHEEVVTTAEEAVRSAKRMGYPVVLKIASEDISHKTEIGGVVLDVRNADAVRQAHNCIMSNARQRAPWACLDGVLVAPMIHGGVELIVGVSRDPVFGPIIMVGMGGIYAEILKDVAVQIAPVSKEEAQKMICSLRMFPLLDGVRGQQRADVAAAALIVAQLSEFACRYASDVAEIDMNPVLVKPEGEGAIVLDALMVRRESLSQESA